MRQPSIEDDAATSSQLSVYTGGGGRSVCSVDLTNGSLDSDQFIQAAVKDDEYVGEDELPEDIVDPEFFGIDPNSQHKCHHKIHPVRKVAFVYAATGRRFLGCPLNGAERCRWVMWIDEPWGPVLSRSIMRVWDQSEERAALLESKKKELERAYLELLTERTDMAAEHERIVSQLTNIVADTKFKMARRLDFHTKLCVASISSASIRSLDVMWQIL